jgi:type VI secretion system secreted protein VgrG
MAAWSRDHALLAMTSPLGADVLIPISLSAHEAISQPFQFEVTAVCQSGRINPDTLLNQPACVVVQDSGTPMRYYHGIVRSVSAEGPLRSADSVEAFESYRVILVPRLWFLQQTIDCRVYQKMSAGGILQQMFKDAGLTDLSGPPSSSVRDYTVQFNETDLHFATRLMEEEGWYYFFTHEASKHTLVIANQNSAFQDIPNATLYMVGGADTASQLLDFNHAAVTVRGKMQLRDYDPTKPDTQLSNQQPTVLKTGGASARDHFRWPALTFDNGTVTNRTKFEMEAAEAAASLYDGASHWPGLVPGGKFRLQSKPASPYDNTYAVRSVTHHATDGTWINQGGSATYSNSFVCFPASVTWREPMVTPRPRMDGIHTALVMGPQSAKDAPIKSQDGEEIYTDDLARVKVRFYWDWRAEATGDASCWARVIQPWAGKGWGAQFIPRVGTEVAVAFVDGDPDRPIVVGGLYNGRDTPIYPVAEKTKSGFRTRSSLSGGTSQANELTFDDKAGSELIFTHAQKDMTTEVEHDQTLTVDNCRVVTVKKDETVSIQNNQSITVAKDRSVTVSQGNSSLTVSQGNHAETISQGNYAIDVSAGKMTAQAMQSMELTVGQSSIKLTPEGITISALQIKLAGQLKGSFDGGVELDLTGAIVKIN